MKSPRSARTQGRADSPARKSATSQSSTRPSSPPLTKRPSPSSARLVTGHQPLESAPRAHAQPLLTVWRVELCQPSQESGPAQRVSRQRSAVRVEGLDHTVGTCADEALATAREAQHGAAVDTLRGTLRVDPIVADVNAGHAAVSAADHNAVSCPASERGGRCERVRVRRRGVQTAGSRPPRAQCSVAANAQSLRAAAWATTSQT